MRFTLFSTLIITLLLNSGCAVLLVGAGAAGTVAYVKGDQESVEPYTVKQVYLAAKAALDDLGIAVINSSQDTLSAQITARNALDKKIAIKITYVTESSSKLSIRVAVFGSETESQKIYQKIKKHLD